MRTLILAALIFFSLAPAALAQETAPSRGSSCHFNSDCQPGYFCDPLTKTCSGPATGNPTPTPTPAPAQTTPPQTTGANSFGPSGNSSNTSGSLGQTGTNAPSGSGPSVTLINPLKGVDCMSGNGNCLMAFLSNILKFVVQIGTIVIILMLVYIGFLFVVAQGSETKLAEAKKALLWTIIGALVLLGAQAISMGIQATVQALGG